jgi:Zn ribbon nucleic-acid-binding protein
MKRVGNGQTCPKCGSATRKEKAINLRNGAELEHEHCYGCGYDSDSRWNEEKVKL